MEQITIIRANGQPLNLFSQEPLVSVTSAQQTRSLMAEDTVSLTIKSKVVLPFSLGDRLLVFGSEYVLNLLPTVRRYSDHYEYDLVMEGPQYDLLKVVYMDVDATGSSTGGVFSLTGDLAFFLGILISNASRVMGSGSWLLGDIPPSNTKTLSFSEENCLGALQKVCSEFEVEFDVRKTGEIRTIEIGSQGQILPDVFQYGHGYGLYSLTRKIVKDKNVFTRLYAYGSSKNLRSDYRDYAPKLKINEGGYIESAIGIAAYGIIEGVKTWEDIYPKREGTVSGINVLDPLQFTDSSLDFDLTEKVGETTTYLIPGTSAKVHFNTGGLAGYEFEVGNYDHPTKTFTLIPYKDERGVAFPGDSVAFQAAPGDKYVLLDIMMPASYIAAAEAELNTRAQALLDQAVLVPVQYDLSIDELYLKEKSDEGATTNVFELGDLVPILDEELGIDKASRVVSFRRDIINPYRYELAIADSYEITLLERIIADRAEVRTIIKLNDLRNPVRARAALRNQRELLSLVFDTEGNYYTDRIKPLSIETSMLSVGAKSQQLQLLNIVIEPNYAGNKNVVRVNGGQLVHLSIADTIKTWNIASGTTSIADNEARYIYAKCGKANTAGTIIFSTQQIMVDQEATFYHFMLGVLHTVDSATGVRQINLTYGASIINGRFIKTGRLESADGATYFDLDEGEIGGNVIFRSAIDGQFRPLSDVEQELATFIDVTLPGLLGGTDGQIVTWYYEGLPTLANEPAVNWTDTPTREEHVNDLYYDTVTYKAYRFKVEAGAYSWEEVIDERISEALSAAASAQDTADKKRRVFVTTPTPPYEIGDLWTDGTRLKRATVNKLANQAYSSADWTLAVTEPAFQDFLDNTLPGIVANLDGQIVTWYYEGAPTTANQPAVNWTDNTTRDEHLNDLYYDTLTYRAYRYKVDAGVYSWQEVLDERVSNALALASRAQDTADGKRRVFYVTPYPPYDRGDMWSDGADLRICNVAKQTGQSYNAQDWGKATLYDNTVTAINGGVVTSGTLQLAGQAGSILAGITGEGTASTSVRFWAGATYENRALAPFRVLQSGEVFARIRIELMNQNNVGQAGICGANSSADGPVRLWAGVPYQQRNAAPWRVESDGAMYATIGKIGDWTISAGGITNSSGTAYVLAQKFVDSTHKTAAMIGSNIFPATFGGRGAASFEASETDAFSPNYAAVFSAKNGSKNYSIYAYEGVSFLSEALVNGRKTEMVEATAPSTNYVVDPSDADFFNVYPFGSGARFVAVSKTPAMPIKDGKEIVVYNRNDSKNDLILYDTVRANLNYYINGGEVVTLIYAAPHWLVKSKFDNNF